MTIDQLRESQILVEVFRVPKSQSSAVISEDASIAACATRFSGILHRVSCVAAAFYRYRLDHAAVALQVRPPRDWSQRFARVADESGVGQLGPAAPRRRLALLLGRDDTRGRQGRQAVARSMPKSARDDGKFYVKYSRGTNDFSCFAYVPTLEFEMSALGVDCVYLGVHAGDSLRLVAGPTPVCGWLP